MSELPLARPNPLVARAAVTRLAFAAALLLALASPAPAAKKTPPAAPPPAPLSAAGFAVQRTVLDNGLVVLLREDHSVPAVTFWQWFETGSRDEQSGATGLSHFFEHMMFNGSANVPPQEYDRILESNGGASNAFTDRDMTAYYEDVAADRLDVVFRLDSDRMAGLTLLPEPMKSELEVVKEERRSGTDDDVDGLLDEQLYATAFVAAPYRTPVIGWMGDLDRITREECVSWFRTHYAPNRCILVLVGDFDSASALAKIRAAFGPIPRQPPPPPPANSEPEQNGERRAEVRFPAENVTFMIGYKAPAARDPDAPALEVLARILADGESSRLHRALVYERRLALDVSAEFAARIDPSLFELTVELRPGVAAAAGLTALDAELARLADAGPTARELEAARNRIEADFVRRLATNNGTGSQLAFYEHVYGDWREMFGVLDRCRAVTASDCRRVAQRTFDARRRTVVTLVPEDEDAGAPK